MIVWPMANMDGFLPSDGHAMVLGVEAQASTKLSYGAFSSGQLSDRNRHSVCKLLSFIASYERTVVASKLIKVTKRAVYSCLKLKR